MWVFALFIVMLFIAALMGVIDLFKFKTKTLRRFILGSGFILTLNYYFNWNFTPLFIIIFTLIMIGFISWSEWE